MAAAGVVPRSTIELDNVEAAKQMVRQGLGVALLPHTAIAADVARGWLRVVAMPGLPTTRRRIVAVRRAGRAYQRPPCRGSWMCSTISTMCCPTAARSSLEEQHVTR